eukprot:c15730_g1_i1.p2 GENE.c15730_g1_i1~~c15730_g1_i1.p2  ORF type:complete len:162 (-),score=58.02 c15730_g1_i1:332-817(-)
MDGKERKFSRVGCVVWAKTKGYPWWPAVTITGIHRFGKKKADELYKEGQYCVSYFASAKGNDLDQVAWLDEENILPFESNMDKAELPKPLQKKHSNRRFPEAVTLAQEYLNNPPKLTEEPEPELEEKEKSGHENDKDEKKKKKENNGNSHNSEDDDGDDDD